MVRAGAAPALHGARLLAIAAAAVALALATWAVYTWPVTVQYFPTYAVTYSKGLWQSFELEVVNETGHPVHFCATLYGWLPNGSFVRIGWGCGKGSKGLDPEPLRRYAEAWRDYRGVEPGVIVLLTYVNGTDHRGRPTLARAAKSFTVQPERVLRGESVRARVVVSGRPPREDRSAPAAVMVQSGWPPGRIMDPRDCIPLGDALYCYEWWLDAVNYSALDTRVPTVAARVKAASDAYKVNDIVLSFSIDATTSAAVYFSASAAISGGGASVSYSQDIYAVVLSNSKTKNNTSTWGLGRFAPCMLGPGVYVVGFYGDVAVARYKEYVVVYIAGGAYDYYETGYVADMYLARPSASRMQRGVLALFEGVDWGPTDDYGYSRMFNLIESKWNYSVQSDPSAINIDSWDVVSDVGGKLEISIGVPLLPARLTITSVNVNLAFSAGSETKVRAHAYAVATLRYDYKYYYRIYGRYYYPNATFEFQGGYYRIPSIFVDISVS
jgi:hypothetical protein